VREFVSKSIAGGLSAAVVLLWWPLLFEGDGVASWLARGIAWTLCVELLLVALMPLERALWETPKAERLGRRVSAAGSRLHAGSSRRRLSRLAGVAVLALTIPAVLVAAGLHQQQPTKEAAVKVVKVTRVVQPVTHVKRVVKEVPAAQVQAPGTSSLTPPASSGPAPAPVQRDARVAPERTAPEPRSQTRIETREESPETDRAAPVPAPEADTQKAGGGDAQSEPVANGSAS
jgi:hypothetical protein